MSILAAVILWTFTFMMILLTITYALFFALALKKPNLQVEDTLKKEQWQPYAAEIREAIRWYEAQEKKQLYILTRDNIRLTGWYMAAEGESRGRVILCHDYRTPALVNFAPLVRAYHESGYDVLLTESRAHHESLGRFVCFGIRERFDLKLWIECVNKVYGADKPIFLHGVGMGGTTVLMTAGLELPENVNAVLAEGAYTSPYALVKKIMKTRFHMAPEVLLRYFDFWCRGQAGFHLRKASTQEALRATKLPVFLIHGEGDTMAPIGMAEANFEACGSEEKHFVRVACAGHGNCLFEARENAPAALNFFSEHLALPPAEAVIENSAEHAEETTEVNEQ